MRLLLLPILFAVTPILAGCGKPYAENVSPDEAGQALKTALDAWKSGKKNDELQNMQPSIVMNESDWTNGGKLLDYKMAETGAMTGRQAKWLVSIKLEDAKGDVKEKKATYVIDTIPRIVIVRDTFANMRGN